MHLQSLAYLVEWLQSLDGPLCFSRTHSHFALNTHVGVLTVLQEEIPKSLLSNENRGEEKDRECCVQAEIALLAPDL